MPASAIPTARTAHVVLLPHLTASSSLFLDGQLSPHISHLFCRTGEVDPKVTAELLRRGESFKYEADFDTNGILYWLGTNGKTMPYTNPATNSAVTVTASSIGGGTAQGFIEHTHRVRAV